MSADVLASPSRLAQFYALTKPRVVQLIVFCAFIGMVLAIPGAPSADQWLKMAVACFGIWLVSGAAAAFNCLVERHIDARMKRTSWRPTAKGELTPQQALGFSAILCTVGAAVLLTFTNPLTMCLGRGGLEYHGVDHCVTNKGRQCQPHGQQIGRAHV